MEYATQLKIDRIVLDHCCGDGLFASLAWNKKKITAGCDIQDSLIKDARRLGIYNKLDVSDVSKQLPYEDAIFDLVFNNSALEHIENLDDALHEVFRVLKPGGEFAFNVLNHRYFEWWPLDETTRRAYRECQPFYHALSITSWSEQLSKVGLSITSYQGYFDEQASRQLAKLDYWFSGTYIRNIPFRYVKLYLRFIPIMSILLYKKLGRYHWKTAPDAGAGYFIKAIKKT
jgi:ubiquinone/menaquinone biosynthesis C-methylase UbiE